MVNSNPPTFLTEVFKINVQNLPELYAYQLVKRSTEPNVRIGRKLADRLMRTFKGYWIWSDDYIVTDSPQEDLALEEAIKHIRKNEKDNFRDLSGVNLVEDWIPTAQAQAEFMAQGLFSNIAYETQQILEPPIDLDGKAIVRREADIRGWVVKGEPAISISIESQVIYKDDLKTYAARLSNPDEELKGLFVCDKVRLENGTVFKGEIISIVGRIDYEISRQELLDVAQKEGSKEIIKKADKGEYVVQVGNNEYEYVLSALRIIAFTKHYKRFGIDTEKAQKVTWITPKERAGLVKKISDIARNKYGLITDTFTSKQQGFFRTASNYRYDPQIRFANNKTATYRGGSSLLSTLGNFGFYSRIANMGTPEYPLRIGVINASKLKLDATQEALKQQMNDLGFVRVDFISSNIAGLSRLDFERTINNLQAEEPHIVLAIIPESDSSDEDDWGPYYDFKSLMMNVDIPSQVIDPNTARKTNSLKYIMQNVAFGMASKLGNIPYILANPLEYGDWVVGIDIARKRNSTGTGTQNAAAIAQIYHKGGYFAKCRVVETPLEGETVPAKVLRSLFPLNEFQNKTAIIHRDGPFRGDEIDIIQNHIAQLGGTAYFVEIIKSGAPRLYKSHQGQIDAPPIGMSFWLSETEAFVVTSESSTATPQPLQIRTRPPFTIGKALHSTLMLTLMHHGSVRRPKLPITIHYSDKIGYLALRGVKPTGGQSSDMYWL